MKREKTIGLLESRNKYIIRDIGYYRDDVEDIIELVEEEAQKRAKKALIKILDFNGGKLPATKGGTELFVKLFEKFYNEE